MTSFLDERDRESLRRDRRSPDEDVRRLAAERAAALPPEEAVEHLVEGLGDPSWRVRKTAVERIVALPETAGAARALVAALADGENPGRRNAAVEALVRCGARSVPALLGAAESDDPDVRKLVLDALAGIGDARATRTLVERLGDADPNVRAAAADALGAVGGDEAVRALRRRAAAPDEDGLVRFSALHALAALEVPVRAREIRPVLEDAVLAPAGLALLGRCEDDDEAEEILCKALRSGPRAGREAAVRSLLRVLAGRDGARADALVARIREAAAPAAELVADTEMRLDDADLPTRLAWVQLLGLLGAEEAARPIVRAGGDEAVAEVALAALESLGARAERALDAAWEELDGPGRRVACEFFGRCGGDASARRLLALLDDPDPELRTVAAHSIGARRLSAGLAPLVRRLARTAAEEDFEAEKELEAVSDALVALASEEAGPAATEEAADLLSSCLEGAREPVRTAVASVFGRIGGADEADRVGFLLKDPSARVRRAAVDALARLAPGAVSEPLRLALADESSSVRIAAATALGDSEGPHLVDDLRRLVDDEDARVRAAAVRALGRRASREEGADERVLVLLQVALADEAPVALAACEALAERGGAAAARAAQGALERAEPEVLQAAVRCLGAHAPDDALASLFPLVSHPEWSVRAEVLQVLSLRGCRRAVPAILRRLETEQDEFVRDAILRALRRLEE